MLGDVLEECRSKSRLTGLKGSAAVVLMPNATGLLQKSMLWCVRAVLVVQREYQLVVVVMFWVISFLSHTCSNDRGAFGFYGPYFHENVSDSPAAM